MDNETWTVRVFTDDPCWDTHEKWWMVPMHVIQRFHVMTYTCTEQPCEVAGCVREIRAAHPGCVLVY